MSLDIDYSAHLIRAEQEWAKVYPALLEGKDAIALMALIEHCRECLNAAEFVIRKNTKRK